MTVEIVATVYCSGNHRGNTFGVKLVAVFFVTPVVGLVCLIIARPRHLTQMALSCE